METVEQGTGQDAGQGIDTTIESPLKTAVTAEVLKEKWGLQTPEDVLEAQRAVDFMILSSPGFVSGFMMDVGGGGNVCFLGCFEGCGVSGGSSGRRSHRGHGQCCEYG